MLLELLFTNPILYLMVAVSILLALSIHEYSHAQAAYSLGDPTARDLGRLTINPLAHLDPFGTLFLFLFGIGWGKPVPFNYLNLRNKKWGPALIALAGPGSNLLMAIIVGLSLRFFSFNSPGIVVFFRIFVWLNILLGIFNLIPVPPLDGSHLLFALLPRSFDQFKFFLSKYSFIWLIFAIFFMMYIGIPYIATPLFRIITGIPQPI